MQNGGEIDSTRVGSLGFEETAFRVSVVRAAEGSGEVAGFVVAESEGGKVDTVDIPVAIGIAAEG